MAVLASITDTLERLYDAVSADWNGMPLAAQARGVLDAAGAAGGVPDGYDLLRRTVRAWKKRDGLAPGERAALYYARAVLAVCEGDPARAFERAQMAWGWCAPTYRPAWGGPVYADFGLGSES